MKKCPFTVSCIYAILQQMYVLIRLDLEVYVLLVKYRHSTRLIVRLSIIVLILELRLYGCCHSCFKKLYHAVFLIYLLKNILKVLKESIREGKYIWLCITLAPKVL